MAQPLTQEQIREHAEEIILAHTEDIETLTISEMLVDALEGASDEEHDRVVREVADAISEADVIVTWPDATP